MIINELDEFPDWELYQCKRKEMEYLMFTHKLPVVKVDEKFFYFVNNEELQNALKVRPLMLRIRSKLKI